MRSWVTGGPVSSGQALHGGAGIGIVGQPLLHPDSFSDDGLQLVQTHTEVGVLGDVRQRPDITAHVAAADLPAAGDQHDAERGVAHPQAVLAPDWE